MIDVLSVAAGGALGAVARFLVGRWIGEPGDFPLATLLVNVVGCAAIGLVSGVAERGELQSGITAFLIPGVLGGFTTFSAFALETVTLVGTGRAWTAIGYAMLSVGAGVAVCGLSYRLAAPT